MKARLKIFWQWLIGLFRKKMHESLDEVTDKVDEIIQEQIDEAVADVVGTEEELE